MADLETNRTSPEHLSSGDAADGANPSKVLHQHPSAAPNPPSGKSDRVCIGPVAGVPCPWNKALFMRRMDAKRCHRCRQENASHRTYVLRARSDGEGEPPYRPTKKFKKYMEAKTLRDERN